MYSIDNMKIKIVISQKDHPEAFKECLKLKSTIGNYGLSKFLSECLLNFKPIVKYLKDLN